MSPLFELSKQIGLQPSLLSYLLLLTPVLFSAFATSYMVLIKSENRSVAHFLRCGSPMIVLWSFFILIVWLKY